ncbi:hypothetical protein OG462_41405 [Streptomyces sp. NBC_01077]|uniref:hypothetical protein n=1 Tax=Streptomyces sp. NBC_01077 TaxID=2903746 RepID=UPI003868FE88|nr:hypothetical protein OG462_41405 [Streptomyces sp. NBC_01077]
MSGAGFAGSIRYEVFLQRESPAVDRAAQRIGEILGHPIVPAWPEACAICTCGDLKTGWVPFHTAETQAVSHGIFHLTEKFDWGVRCAACSRFDAAYLDLEQSGDKLWVLSKCDEHHGVPQQPGAFIVATEQVLPGSPPKKRWWQL